MDLEQKYIEQYKQAHTDSDKFPGVSLGKEILPACSMARLPAPVILANAPLVVVVAVEV